VGQNILLEAVSLGLGAVPVGAFENEKVKRILDLAHLRQGFGGQGGNLEPLYVIPVGYAKE
jgi:nitroreductase